MVALTKSKKDILVRLEDSGHLSTLAALRVMSLVVNREQVALDELEELPEGDNETVSISGSGIFKDAESDEKFRDIFFRGDIQNWQFNFPEIGDLYGPFQIVSLEYSGRQGNEITFEAIFHSTSSINYTSK